MTIYQDRVPYTYLIGWSNLDTWYYGRRTAAYCHPDELWVSYFTSSEEVKHFVEQYGNPDIVEIRKIFTGDDSVYRCSLHEVTVIRRIKAVEKTNWLNKGNSGAQFNTSGKIIAKYLTTGKATLVDVSEFVTNEEIVGINKGIKIRVSSCEHCGKDIAINNINKHTPYCQLNPNRITHFRTGISLSSDIKESMSKNHPNISGDKNPNAKHWILTSPDGEVTKIHGRLDLKLQELNLSRFNLLRYEGKPVPHDNVRSELSIRTAGWKLERAR